MKFIIYISLSICTNYKTNEILSEHDYSKTSLRHYLNKDHTYSKEKGYYDELRKLEADPYKYLNSLNTKDESFNIADKYLKENQFQLSNSKELPVLSKDDMKYIRR